MDSPEDSPDKVANQKISFNFTPPQAHILNKFGKLLLKLKRLKLDAAEVIKHILEDEAEAYEKKKEVQKRFCTNKHNCKKA